MKVVSIVGARPQIIKAAVVSRALRARGHADVLVHTGQQTAAGMADELLVELGAGAPAYRLRVDSRVRRDQIRQMAAAIAGVLRVERPDWVIVFGDTNSTLAGALAGNAAAIPVAHVEAGVRSFNPAMPEEENRIETDRRAALLWCPGGRARAHLAREGITDGVHVIGDVMYDAFLDSRARAAAAGPPVVPVAPGPYFLATVHRAATTDAPQRLAAVLGALDDLPLPVLLPLHPRTADRARLAGFRAAGALQCVAPLGHGALLAALASARAVLTDSGGVQKEAYWLGVPCITLRAETEWMETVEAGWNQLAGDDPAAIARAAGAAARPLARPPHFESPGAGARAVALLEASNRTDILRRFSGVAARAGR